MSSSPSPAETMQAKSHFPPSLLKRLPISIASRGSLPATNFWFCPRFHRPRWLARGGLSAAWRRHCRVFCSADATFLALLFIIFLCRLLSWFQSLFCLLVLWRRGSGADVTPSSRQRQHLLFPTAGCQLLP